MPQDARVFPAGAGGNPAAPTIGSSSKLISTAQSPIRPPLDPFVLTSVEPFVDDDNINGFVDGAGNRIWHVDTSASAKAITFVSAGESTDLDFVVKWIAGTNGLKIVAAAGKVAGTTTFVGAVAGDAYTFRSDGIDYQMVARVGDFITSAGLATGITTGNLTVTGSATFSGTVAFLTSVNVSGTASIGTLVVSGTASFSGTVVMNSLTVLGSASFSGDVYVRGSLAVSATLSVGAAITVGGAPLSSDWKKLGTVALSDVLSAVVSGSWTAYSALKIQAVYKTGGTGMNPQLQLSTDGGGSYFLAGSAIKPPTGNLTVGGAGTNITPTFSGISVVSVEMQAIGINASQATKFIFCSGIAFNGSFNVTGTVLVTSAQNMTCSWRLPSQEATATANSGQVNQISFAHRNAAGTTTTMSAGFLNVYGQV